MMKNAAKKAARSSTVQSIHEQQLWIKKVEKKGFFPEKRKKADGYPHICA